MPSGLAPFERVQFLDEGRLQPQPLRDFTKTGDLTECGKIVVALDGEPEYRIVVRTIDGTFEVWEVVAVEDRSNDLPYLLAGVRLDRIADPIRRSDTQRRIFRIRRLLGDEWLPPASGSGSSLSPGHPQSDRACEHPPVRFRSERRV